MMCIEWIRNWVAGDLISKNKSLEQQNSDLSSTLRNTKDALGIVIQDEAKCTNTLLELKNEIEKVKNVSRFETFLDKQGYPLRTFVYTKRWVLDKKLFPEPMDIRDFIRNEWTLPNLVNVKACMEHSIRYISDNFQYNGALDVWQLPIETETLMAGDCEDSACLKASLARKAGNKDLFCALGVWGNVGHCFNLLWKEGNIYIVENTNNKYDPVWIGDLKNTGTNYHINYIFNENKVWEIDGGTVFGMDVTKDFNIEKRVNKRRRL